jgi:hypothetical protein
MENKRSGKNLGGGIRQGSGIRGQGRMNGPRAAGPVGDCLCPQCGHRQRHERGVPCMRVKCPTCGSAMVRE